MNRSSGRGWLPGFVVGIAGGLLTLVVPTLGWLIVIAFAVPAAIGATRVAALGGLLTGVGSAWMFLLVQSTLRCRAFDAEPGQECVGPDLAPWLTVGSAMLVMGATLTVSAWWRARRA